MTDPTPVRIDIHVDDNSSSEVNNITNNVLHLHQAVQREERQNDKWSESVKRMAKAGLSAARAVAKVTASVAAMAAATGPAVVGLLAAGKALATFGKAAARLTPLLAFLPALAAGFALLKTTLKLAAPGLLSAFEPITRMFVDAEGNASKFTKELQRVVGIDVRPAAAAFVKLNLPAIQTAMARIAYQTNLVVAGFGNWANSSRGIETVKSISKATADFVARLAPHVVAVATAFADLAGRAADPAFKRLGDVIAGILDRLRAWANDTSVDDINRALKDLSGYGQKLRATWGAIRDIGRWLVDNQEKIKHFSDVAAGAAIAIGAATGNVPAVVAGSVALIINHWNDLKGAFTGASPWVSDLMTRWRQDANRIRLTESITRALEAGRVAFNNMTKDIGPKFAEFVKQLKAAWEEWAPLITAWWNTGGKQIFQVAGAAIGGLVMILISAATDTAKVAQSIAEAFKLAVRVILEAFGFIIHGAAKAFSWIPGLGPQLNLAAQQFDQFKNSVNRALDGIESVKTIRINANVYVTGGGSAAGGVDQRTGNSRNAGLSALTSWQRVAEAFAGDRGGSRTGGPVPLTASVQNTIMLDGRPFRAYTDKVALESDARARWHAWNGKR